MFSWRFFEFEKSVILASPPKKINQSFKDLIGKEKINKTCVCRKILLPAELVPKISKKEICLT
jgi:hypothetical protein